MTCTEGPYLARKCSCISIVAGIDIRKGFVMIPLNDCHSAFAIRYYSCH